jgi:hypothetical protein
LEGYDGVLSLEVSSPGNTIVAAHSGCICILYFWCLVVSLLGGNDMAVMVMVECWIGLGNFEACVVRNEA